MTTPPNLPSPSDLRARLEILGDPRHGTDWRTDKRNYVAELGVTAADIPELVSIAVGWAETVAWDHFEGEDEDFDDDELGDESADLNDEDGSDERQDEPQDEPHEQSETLPDDDTRERTDAPTAEASVMAGGGLDDRAERNDSSDEGTDAEDDDEDPDDSDDDEVYEEDDDDGPLDPAVFAPIHAWRALGQLRAAEAVGPLLGTIIDLDACGDDWYLEEYPHVFLKIGPACIPALEAYLRDQSNAEFGRISCATSLTKLAQRYPEHRTRVVAVLLAAMEEDESPNFVGFMISDLLDLRATEGALAIERAFAADRVDLFVSGNWNDVKKELGVPGTGLVPAKLAKATRRLVFRGPSSGVTHAERRVWDEAKRLEGFEEPTDAPKSYKTRKKKSR